MEKNLFEGAKFGDKFVTRDRHVLRYIHGNFKDTNAPHLLFDEITGYTNRYQNNGCRELKKEIYVNCDDIVSRYHEEIDEKKLDELAFDYECQYDAIREPYDGTDLQEAFKAGYRKAMENKI